MQRRKDAMPSKPEKWDYIISGRPYGIMRMAIVGILAAFFIVLTIDQLQPGPNKVPFVALAFGGIATLLTVTLVKLIGRYFYYKICIGPRGFFFKTNPFNGKYYKYTDIERCGEGVIKASRSASSAAPATDRHFFYFTDRSGKKHEALLEYPLYKNEIIILIGRIHSVQTDSFD
jgi:hypothetical protein